MDIWLTFRKHRKLFLKVAIGVTLLGLIVALIMPKSYDLRTSIEIGTAIRGDTPTPIEAPETVKAKLENSLIPMVIHQLNSAEEDDTIEYKISTTIPKKSALIVLTSKTTTDEETQYKKLHNMVIEAITKDHARIINVLNKRVFDLVIDFGTSQSPKSTRPLTTYSCPSRPGHQALHNNFASSLLLRTCLPMTGRRVRMPTLLPLWRYAHDG
ncbi:hypothetical protein [Thiolapillus sp.]|uniref:hypothetical protein n=4 Tax=Thiolapillus sp. TaxID=2017437 RepID=UPI003AF83F0B